MNSNYNKYKKYKFKYKKLIEPFKDIIDKIDINDALLNETYLKNKDYFDNLINIKNESDVYKYKYQKYKTRYLFINKKLNGGTGFTNNNTQTELNKYDVCPNLGKGGIDDQRKELTKNQKLLYYGSKMGKIGASSLLKIMAVFGAAIPGGQAISAVTAIASTGKDVYDYVIMKKYEFIIIYSIFIFLKFDENSDYFIGKEKSLLKILSNYKEILKNNNNSNSKEVKDLIDEYKENINIKLNLLNDGMITILRYNSCMKFIFKFVKDINDFSKDGITKGFKKTLFRYVKKLGKLFQEKNDSVKDENKINKHILNYLVKEKKIMNYDDKSFNKEKEICRINKLINIINSFKELIDKEKNEILHRYSKINCIKQIKNEPKLKLIYLLESSYVYASTNKNSNAILFNGLYNIILQNTLNNDFKLSKEESIQVVNIYELLGLKLRKDIIVKTFYAGDGFLIRKWKKSMKKLKSEIYTTKKKIVTCT